MRLPIVRHIFGKEMLDTLRDKRTLIMMLGVPIVLYPALLIVGLQAALLQQSQLEESESRIAIRPPVPSELRTWIAEMPKATIVEPEAIDVALTTGAIEAIVEADEDWAAKLETGGAAGITVVYDSTEFRSIEALGRIRDYFEEKAESVRDERLRKVGLNTAFIDPVPVEEEDAATPERATGNLIGQILPFLMVLTLALGAFYPAVDVTAGEKERGTFETLLATPVTKLEIVSGKFLSVFVLAMANGLLNLASMGLTFAFVLNQLDDVLGDEVVFSFDLSLLKLGAVFLVMIPLGFFASAVMMCIAVFARSFKEAQNYVTPFLILIILPAGYGTFPSIDLTALNQFVPIANVVLLFRELMTDKAGLDAVFTVFISNGIYAVLAIQFAAWLFQREDVLLSEERGIPITFDRRRLQPREALTPSAALGFYAIAIVVLFIGGSTLQQWRLLPGVALTQWGLLLLPTLLLLVYAKVDLTRGLYLRSISVPALIGTALTAVGASILGMELGRLHNKVLPVPTELTELLTGLLGATETVTGLIITLAVVALSPAICEEVLFRGALLSGLRTRLGPWACMLAVGFMFGLFHVSIHRLTMTTLIGILLTYLVLRTGSIFAGMVAHFINNGLAVLLSAAIMEPVWSKLVDLETVESEGLPLWLLATCGVSFAAGIGIVEADRARKTTAATRSAAPDRASGDAE